jgi:hypothetical protein
MTTARELKALMITAVLARDFHRVYALTTYAEQEAAYRVDNIERCTFSSYARSGRDWIAEHQSLA